MKKRPRKKLVLMKTTIHNLSGVAGGCTAACPTDFACPPTDTCDVRCGTGAGSATLVDFTCGPCVTIEG